MAQRKFLIDGGFLVNDDSEINANLTMTGNILPSVDSDGTTGYDLGSPTAKWRDLYLSEGSLYINNQKVIEDNSGTIIVRADPDQSLTVKTEGTGVLTFQSAQTVNMAATLQMAAGKRITDAGGNAVTFGDKVDMDGNRVVNMGTPINDMDSATKKYVDDKFDDVIGGAPAALDTLNELANALGDDADYAATITTALATKATTVYVDQQVAQAVINANSTSSATTDALDLRLTAVESANTSQATAIAANSAAHVQNASDIAANSTAVANAITTAAADATSKANAAAATAQAYTDTRETAITTAYTAAIEAAVEAQDSLGEMGDVSLGSLGNNQVLRYNSTTGMWSNATQSTDAVTEGSNLYYTDARARAAISVSGDLSYDSSTGVISTQGLASSTTDDLAEGSNLYFTDERVDDRVAALVQAGDNITVSYDDVNGTLTISGEVEDNLSNNTTDDLAEGSTNLYYTDARVDARLGGGSVTSLATPNFSVSSTGASFDVDMSFSNGTTNVFMIDASTGATTIEGGATINNTFNVSGDTTFEGDNTFNISNSSSTSVFAIDVANTTFAIDLDMTVNNEATFNNAVTIEGDNNFTINDSSSTTVFDVDVANNTTVIGGATTVNNDFAITNSSNTNVFDVDVTANTFNVDMDVTLNNATTVNNDFAINNSTNTNVFDVDVTANTFDVALDMTVNNSATFNNNVAINNSSNTTLVDIDVANATYAIDMDLTVNNASTFNNNLTINNSSSTALFDIDVTNATFDVDLDMTVNNSATFNNNLTINNSTSNTMFDIDVVNATAVFNTDMTFNNATVIDNTLEVSNNVTFNNGLVFNIDNSSNVNVFKVDGSTGNVTIGGDLIVQGTTTTVNTEEVNIADNIIVLNSNATGAATANAGIEIERGDDVNKQFIWDEGNDRWSTVGEALAGEFIGDLTGDVTGQVSDISNHNSDDVSEGTTNLYFTAARQTAVANDIATAEADAISAAALDATTKANAAKADAISAAASDATTKANAAKADAISAANAYTDGQVSTEASTRASADAGLQASITAEENARIAGDMGLQTQIDSISIGDGTVTIATGSGLSGGGAFSMNQGNSETVTISLDTNFSDTRYVQPSDLVHVHGAVVPVSSTQSAANATDGGSAVSIDLGQTGLVHYSVYLNRQLLRPTEATAYNATNGQVTFAKGTLSTNDELEIVGFKAS